jgi:hypothetical protein
MKNGLRLFIIIGIFISTPLICGIIGNMHQSHVSDVSGLTSLGITMLGVMGAVASLVIGTIVSFITRASTNSWLNMAGYYVPSAATILFCLSTLFSAS